MTFTQIVRSHQGALRAFLRRLTQNDALADDLAQITFMKAFKSQTILHDPGKVKPWLFQIAYRTFIDAYRKTSRQLEFASEYQKDFIVESQPGLAADIDAAMNNLPEDCRAVVILCLAHGMSHTEVANITRLPLGTVKSHVTRGKAKLRAFLSAYETS